jgi:cysteine desulfurase
MNSASIYLDNNATTKPLPSVTEAVLFSMETLWGNPSSIHRFGQEARQQIDLAREEVAKLINVSPSQITFTSGGTESANLAIQTACATNPDRKVIITSQIEHAAVGEMMDRLVEDGMEVILLHNDGDGVICMEHLEEVLHKRSGEIAVVSLMWCNNETGVVEPLEKAVELCHANDVLIHSDGTQWVAKMPVDLQQVPIDLLSFAAHKFHGPKGVGALYARTGLTISPLVTGGQQERGRRGGTENVPSILGFGVAAKEARDWLTNENISAMEKLRDAFESKLKEVIPSSHINSQGAKRAWTTTSVSFPNVKGELLLLMLSERGVCASSGSACSSGASENSKVIDALETPDDGEWGAIRFSFSRTTTPEEINLAVDAMADVFATLDSMEYTREVTAT